MAIAFSANRVSVAQIVDFVKIPFWGLVLFSKNSCVGRNKFCQETKIFDEIIRVLEAVFAYRQSNPLEGYFFIVPEPR